MFFVRQLLQYHKVSHNPKLTDCRLVHLIDNEKQCKFASEHPDCTDESSLIQYIPFFFCNFNESMWEYCLGFLFMILLLIIAFVILGTTADSFFCPALAAISSFLHLSENVAGVTILAFGNGSPDIFTSIAAAPSANVSLILSELLGAAIFITTVGAGLILLACPFKMYGSGFLRDCIFFLVAVMWIYFIFYDNHLSYWETTGLIGLYLLYLFVVLLGNYRENKLLKKDTALHERALSEIKRHDEMGRFSYLKYGQEHPRLSRVTGAVRDAKGYTNHDRSSTISIAEIFLQDRSAINLGGGLVIPPAIVGRPRSVHGHNVIDQALRAERVSVLHHIGLREHASTEMSGHGGRVGVVFEGTSEALAGYTRPRGLFKEFFYEMIPVDWENWQSLPWYFKVSAATQAPIIFIMKLVVPVVNHTALNNGWCKLLNTLHCITVPLFSCFVTDVLDTHVYKELQLWMIMLIVGTGFSILVFFTSVKSKPPKYHIVYAFLGFIASIVVVYRVADEIVNILLSFGVIFKISETTLGLTVLAWGNSIGDLISNTAIARAGFPKMGFSACFGGPLFNTLVGLGISMSMAIGKSKSSHPYMPCGDADLNCMLFLVYSLVSSLIAFPIMHFQARRSFGLYMLFLYGMFLIYSILCEVKLTHTMGTQHKV